MRALSAYEVDLRVLLYNLIDVDLPSQLVETSNFYCKLRFSMKRIPLKMRRADLSGISEFELPEGFTIRFL